MKKHLLFILLLVLGSTVLAQRTTVTQLPYNPQMRALLANSMQYLESDFAPGNISFKDGTLIQTLLNYNILFDEMHFVSETDATGKQQILTLTNFDQISIISIGNRFFVHQGRHGILEVLVEGDPRLLKKTRLELKPETRARDGYGYLPESASVTRLSYHDMGGQEFLYAPDREKILAGNTVLTEKYFMTYEDEVLLINSFRAITRTLTREQRAEVNNFTNQMQGRWNDEPNLRATFMLINRLQ